MKFCLPIPPYSVRLSTLLNFSRNASTCNACDVYGGWVKTYLQQIEQYVYRWAEGWTGEVLIPRKTENGPTARATGQLLPDAYKRTEEQGWYLRADAQIVYRTTDGHIDCGMHGLVYRQSGKKFTDRQMDGHVHGQMDWKIYSGNDRHAFREDGRDISTEGKVYIDFSMKRRTICLHQG